MCWGPHYAKRDAEILDRAEEIAWDGPVCWGDRYWRDAGEALDWFDGEGINPPEFLHTCLVRHYALDGDAILQQIIENASVDDHDVDTLEGVDEFMAAVKAFNEANRTTEYWEPDYDHKVWLVPSAHLIIKRTWWRRLGRWARKQWGR